LGQQLSSARRRRDDRAVARRKTLHGFCGEWAVGDKKVSGDQRPGENPLRRTVVMAGVEGNPPNPWDEENRPNHSVIGNPFGGNQTRRWIARQMRWPVQKLR
jgi:hypothetical protein